MKINQLSVGEIAAFIKNRGSEGNGGRKCDGGYLWLNVRATGTASWEFRYPGGTISKELPPLGPDTIRTSLAQARAKAGEWRGLLVQGIDPRAERRRIEHEAANARSFRECALEYIEKKLTTRKGSTKNRWMNDLIVYIFPTIGHLPVGEIDRRYVMQIIGPVWATNAHARMILSRMRLVLGYAIEHGYRSGPNPAIWKDEIEHLLPSPAELHPVEHHPALHPSEMFDLFQKVEQYLAKCSSALPFSIVDRCAELMLRPEGITGPELVAFTGWKAASPLDIARRRNLKIVRIEKVSPRPRSDGRGGKPALRYFAEGSFKKARVDDDRRGALMLMLQILTAVRPHNVREARWKDFDLEKRVWTIPNLMMKGKPHLTPDHHVYLTDATLNVLQRVPRVHPELLFPAQRFRVRTREDDGTTTSKAPPSDMLVRLGYQTVEMEGRVEHRARTGARRDDGGGSLVEVGKGRMRLRKKTSRCTPHSFRTSFEMFGYQGAFDKHAVDMCLAHMPKGLSTVQRSYIIIPGRPETRHRDLDETYLWDERRRLMDAWSAQCTLPPAERMGANIVTMKRRRA